jgi:hypothetical protein
MLCSGLLLLFTVDFASVASYLQLVSRRCHLLIPGVLSAVSALACVCLYIASVHSSLLPSLSYLTPHAFFVAITLQLTMITQHAVVLLGVIMLMSSFGTARSQPQSHLRNAIRKGVSPLLSAGKEDDRQSLVSKFEEETLSSIDVNALGARSQAHSRKLAESLAGSTLWTQFLQDIDGEAAGDFSGLSVALSSDGKRVAIGAIGNGGENGNATFSGHVRVFDLTGSTPTQIGQDIDGEAAGNQSGISIALSSDGTRVCNAYKHMCRSYVHCMITGVDRSFDTVASILFIWNVARGSNPSLFRWVLTGLFDFFFSFLSLRANELTKPFQYLRL